MRFFVGVVKSIKSAVGAWILKFAPLGLFARALGESDDRLEAPREDGSLLSEIIFLGSGSSSGNPNLGCVMDPANACAACQDAIANPTTSRNRRGNPSLLIRYRAPGHGSDQQPVTVLIDVGKTFKQAATRWFHEYKVRSVDGICLTHEHADAMLGLDDVRELQRFNSDWRCNLHIPWPATACLIIRDAPLPRFILCRTRDDISRHHFLPC